MIHWQGKMLRERERDGQIDMKKDRGWVLHTDILKGRDKVMFHTIKTEGETDKDIEAKRFVERTELHR